MVAIASHEQMAREYVARNFGQDGPGRLSPLASFDERPLEGEGRVTVFSFTGSRDGRPEEYRVVAGETEPNYYPAWDLSPEDTYNLHLGTRFMLVLQVSQVPLDELPATVEADITGPLARIAPGEEISSFRPVAAFNMEGQLHVVSRLRLAEEELYVIGGDLPLGIYRRIDLRPHVVYRLHLGKVIRMEEEQPSD
jgi:hypothetical protein